jgi:hypothetical protein
MKKRSLILSFSVFVLLAVFAGGASAQAVRTPEPNSPERKAILDALRVPVERDLKQKIVFVVTALNVSGNWAFISGQPTRPDGSRPDLSKTAWKGHEDLFDDNFFGLLKKTGGKWRVVKHALGCTDVCYLDWPAKYKAPKRIFPFD